MPEILQYREMRDDYDSSVDALGAIWGPHSEESFWDALKAILEYSFGVQVIIAVLASARHTLTFVD
jgi:hypothetical protein